MDAPKSVVRYLALFAVLGLLTATAQAQTSEGTLEMLTPVEGRVGNNEEQTWTFNGASGGVVSLYVKDISGGFDPVISVRNSTGNELIANDDYQYPNNGDALLEAITIPRAGTYTVTVAGFNGQAGAYRLTLLPGFSELNLRENFNGRLTWEMLTNTVQMRSSDGSMELTGEGSRLRGIAIQPDTEAPTNYYAQVKVNVTGGADGWIVGMATRMQDNDQYYVFGVNSRGEWRFLLHQNAGDQVIRDWTPHPAIVPDKATFTLGLLANGIGYDFFYDGQVIGRVSHTQLPAAGGFGLVIETFGSPSSQTTARFDDLTITVPTLVNNQTLIPQQLIVGTPNDMVQELQRRGLIPGGGEMSLTVNESFVESRRPGVERLMVGRGMTYQDFALGTRVSWQAASTGMSGCGLVIRAVEETRYALAFIDQMGGYGLSQRDGDSFRPGIFGEIPDMQPGQQHLLIVARASKLYYYINGQFKGTLESPAVAGAVGDAVVNFEPISTSCTFTETWLWRWTEN